MMVYRAPNRWPGRSVALLNGNAPLADESRVRSSSDVTSASAPVTSASATTGAEVPADAEASQRGHRPKLSSAVPHREQNIGICE